MKVIKKLINIVVVLLCIISFNLYWNNIPVFAAGDNEIVVSSTQGNKGDEVTLKVKLQSNSGLAGLQYSLQYDPAALSLVSATAIENTFKEPIINTEKEGVIVYVFAEATSNTRTGDLMEIKFKILDGANNDNISLKLIDVMGVDNDVNKVNVKTNIGGIQLPGMSGENNNSDTQNNAESNNNQSPNNNATQGNNAEQDNNNGTQNNNNEAQNNNNNATDNNGNINNSNSINNTQTDKDGNIISNDKNNSDKKSNKGIIIVLVIFIIAAVAVAGYFIYKKNKNNKDNNRNDNDSPLM